MKDTFKVLGYVILFIPFILISIIKSFVTIVYNWTERTMHYCASVVDTE